MPLYNLPNMSSGMDGALTGVVTAVPVFIPMFLIFVFGVIFLGGMISQRRREGYSDAPMWATMASLSTFLISLVLTLISGLISLGLLSIVVVITIMSAFWLFMDKGRNEN